MRMDEIAASLGLEAIALRQENAAIKEAVKNYFTVWANKGKKPGWCKRVEEAKRSLDKLTN